MGVYRLTSPVACRVAGGAIRGLTMTDENEWRVSSTGYSIKTGWGDNKRIVCSIPGGAAKFDATFGLWMRDAELICALYNDHLRKGVGSVVKPL